MAAVSHSLQLLEGVARSLLAPRIPGTEIENANEIATGSGIVNEIVNEILVQLPSPTEPATMTVQNGLVEIVTLDLPTGV